MLNKLKIGSRLVVLIAVQTVVLLVIGLTSRRIMQQKRLNH